MKKTLKYFFSTCLLCFLINSSYSQDERIKGLRLGVDLSRFSLYFLEPERQCFEVSADFEALRNLYPTVEYGQQKVSLNKTIDNYYPDGTYFFKSGYYYKSDGSYYRIGADYSFLKVNAQNQYDMLFAGLRYGFANMSHYAEDITIGSGYWGSYSDGSVPENKIKAQWIEIAIGLRAELFKNFFMGWSFRGRILIDKTKDEYMDPYSIPGFGDGSKNSGFGFNFSIYYKIPMFKVKNKPALKDKKE
jgi:hypothetical protein